MVVKKRKVKKRKTKTSRHFDSFSEKSLKKYINMIKKVRKKKQGKKKKKVGLTNTISLLNLLYNVDLEKKKKPRRNLMKGHAFRYPSMIRDVDVDNLWNTTKISSTGKKARMVGSMNNAMNQFSGYSLLYPATRPARKLSKAQRGPVNVISRDEVVDNDVAVTTAPKRTMPPLASRPSRAPPIRYRETNNNNTNYEYSSDSESSSDSERRRKKKRYV